MLLCVRALDYISAMPVIFFATVCVILYSCEICFEFEAERTVCSVSHFYQKVIQVFTSVIMSQPMLSMNATQAIGALL